MSKTRTGTSKASSMSHSNDHMTHKHPELIRICCVTYGISFLAPKRIFVRR